MQVKPGVKRETVTKKNSLKSSHRKEKNKVKNSLKLTSHMINCTVKLIVCCPLNYIYI